MAGTILKNVLSFTDLVVGVPSVQAHRLILNGLVPLLPQLVAANAPNFTITADTVNVTVTRTTPAPAAVDIYVEHWHTIEEVLPLLPVPTFVGIVPFVIASGDGGSGGVASNGAMFYGTTTGTGSEGNDYAATVAVGADVPFPRNGPTAGAPAVRDGVSTTDFEIAASGVHEISWQVGFTEASELQLIVNGLAVANTTAMSGAGTQQNTNTVLATLVAGDIISIRNPAGNVAALTVTPADGALTHAQAPNLVIKRVS